MTIRNRRINRNDRTSHLAFVSLLALAALLVGCASNRPENAGANADHASNTLTVMTYNIHHGEGTDGVFDLERIADVIEAAAPDLVALQEVDRSTARSGNVDQAAEIASITGMHHAFARAIDFDGGQYGVAVLSRFPIDEVVRLPLSFTEGYEARAALAVDVHPWGEDDLPVRFVATHWQHNLEADRVAQAKDVDARFGIARVPEYRRMNRIVILAGDLNAQPGEDPLNVLRSDWRCVSFDNEIEASPKTWPSNEPTVAIDHVYVSPRNAPIKEVNVEVIDERIASDHRPVVVALERTPN